MLFSQLVSAPSRPPCGPYSVCVRQEECSPCKCSEERCGGRVRLCGLASQERSGKKGLGARGQIGGCAAARYIGRLTWPESWFVRRNLRKRVSPYGRGTLLRWWASSTTAEGEVKGPSHLLIGRTLRVVGCDSCSLSIVCVRRLFSPSQRFVERS